MMQRKTQSFNEKREALEEEINDIQKKIQLFQRTGDDTHQISALQNKLRLIVIKKNELI